MKKYKSFAVFSLILLLSSIAFPSIETGTISSDGANTCSIARTRDTFQAMDFDGIDDYVFINPDDDSLKIIGALTLEAWIYIDQYPTTGDAMIIGSAGPIYCMRIYPDGRMAYHAANAYGNYFWAYGSTSVPKNSWIHIAIVRDVNSHLTFYINGTIDSGEDSEQVQDYWCEVAIGGHPGDSNNRFDGKIDEVRVWNIARTQAEIQTAMRMTLNGDESGLAGYWPLDGNVEDLTSNNNDGTIIGGAQFVDSDAPFGDNYGAIPSATTSAASSIMQTTATLNGSVNPNGWSTTITFEYGTTTSYGSQVQRRRVR